MWSKNGHQWVHSGDHQELLSSIRGDGESITPNPTKYNQGRSDGLVKMNRPIFGYSSLFPLQLSVKTFLIVLSRWLAPALPGTACLEALASWLGKCLGHYGPASPEALSVGIR